MAAPRTFNLTPAARKVLGGGKCNVLLRGDSLSTLASSPRWGRSWIRKMDVDWRGMVCPVMSGITSSDEGFVQFNNRLTGNVAAGGTMPDGATVVPATSGFRFASDWNASDVGFGTASTRLVSTTHTALRGDWTAGKPITYKVNFLKSTVGNIYIEPIYRRNAVGVQTLTALDLSTLAAGTSVRTFNFNASSASVGSVGAELLIGYYVGNDANKGAFVGSASIEVAGKTTGVFLDWIAGGGWRTLNHLPPSYGGTSGVDDDRRLTDEQLVDRMIAHDSWPDVIFLMLGTNMQSDENDGDVTPVFSERIHAIIDRDQALAVANGKPRPFTVLQAPWQQDSDPTRNAQIADAFYEIAQERPQDAGMINYYKIFNDNLGAWSNWKGEMLHADGIHQAEAGADYSGSTLNIEMKTAARVKGQGVGLSASMRIGI